MIPIQDSYPDYVQDDGEYNEEIFLQVASYTRTLEDEGDVATSGRGRRQEA